VAVAVIGLAALAFFLLRKRRREQPKNNVHELAATGHLGSAVPGQKYEKVGAPVYEAPTNAPTYEIDSTPLEPTSHTASHEGIKK
jgi:hypothetical protein